jgi:hypothetical protein
MHLGLKNQFTRWALLQVAGTEFTVSATEQISDRLDAKAAGNSWATPFTASRPPLFRP